MKCYNCNVNNRADAFFCKNCGSRIIAINTNLQQDRYVIKMVVGQGGMGRAMVAEDRRLSNKLVVIKELFSDNPTQRLDDISTFEHEIQNMVRINHPLVPSVTDKFQEGQSYFMVQKYIAGENFEEHIKRINQPMIEQEMLICIAKMLDLLSYLSYLTPKIIHKDIKPTNIILKQVGELSYPYLVNFAIPIPSTTGKTEALGTPGYAPPEQYLGTQDERSDLYALAATLHHLLTNRDPRNYPPFAYPSARSLNPRLSLEVDHILSRALTIDSNKRYPNAAAMKRDIDNFLQK